MAGNRYDDWLRLGQWPESFNPFILPPETYRWPMYVLGLAGTGKSTLLANLALRFHALGEGVLVIDVKDGDLAESVAQRTDPDKLIYIAPGQCYFNGIPHHWSMNVLEVTDRSRLGFARVHSNVMAMFERMERADYSIMTQLRYHLDMSIRLALYQSDATLLTVRRIMTEQPYRLKLLQNDRISSEVREHFARFDDNKQTTAYTRAQAVNSSIPRLKELLTDPMLHYLITQPKSTVHLDEWLDAGKLVVCNFASGLSSSQSEVLGNLMMALFTNTVFARETSSTSRVWRLVADEFDRLAGRNFAELIDKARSYRTFPVMSHQNIDQLKSGGRGEVFNAASSAPVVINFRTSKQDEATMRRWVKDEELSELLTSLKRFQASVTLFDGLPGLVDPGQSRKILLDPLQGEDNPTALAAAIASQKAYTVSERELRSGKTERPYGNQTVARTGRVHWKKPDNPKPLELIQQGYQALNYLTIFPAFTGWQVCKLLFLGAQNRDGVTRSDGAAKRAANRACLRPLKNLGLVGVKPIARLDNPLAKWELNYLTPAGHKALTEYRTSLGLATLPYRSAADLTYQTINPHAMAIIDAGVSAYAACTRAGVTVEVWLDDRAIRSLSKREQLHWPMEPDFLLVLNHEGEKRAFFGEVDLGTESVDSPRANSFSTKLENYKRYFKELRAGDPWLRDLPQPQLLVVAPSERRLQNLKDVTQRAGGRRAYWFTESRYLEPPYSFSGEVWQRIGLDGYHSIFSLFGAS